MCARLLLALAAAVLCFATPISADELRLKNGDRITGAVQTLADGKLTVKAAYGEVVVDWSDVAALRLDEPLVIGVRDRQPAQGTLTIEADGQATVALVNAPAATVPAGDIVSIAPPEPPWTLDGGANAGFLNTGGNTDVQNLRLDGEAVVRAGANRYTATAVVNRGADRGRTTARNATAAGRYDRFLTDRVYVNANGIFTNDRFRDLDLRTAVGAGIGYQIWDTSVLSLAVDGGFGYVRQNFATIADESYGALREAVKLQWLPAGPRAEFFHQHDGYFGVTGGDNLFLRLQNGVRFALVAGLVTTFQFDVDYDRNPAPGRKSTDRVLAVTFGYRF